MLGDVLERLQTAEVDGQLDLRGMAAQALIGHADRDRRALHCRAQRGGEAVLREHVRVDPARDALQLVERLVELPLELLDDRLLLGLQLLAREAEMHAERDEPLLGGVVEIAADPAPLGVGGGESARLGGAQLALESPGLDGEQRRRGRGVDELRVLGESVVRVEGGNREAVASDLRPLPAGGIGRGQEVAACCVAELSGGGIPVAEPQRRVVERVDHDRVPALGCGPVGELAQELSERLAGEEIGLQERDREAEREHDPHPDEQPRERVVRSLTHPDHEHGEVEDEERRDEQQRGRGHGDERSPLRPCRGPEAPNPDGDDAGDDGQPDVGDELRHRLEQPRLGADLERIAGGRRRHTRQAVSVTDEHRGEEQRRAEEERQHESEGHEQPAVGGVFQPAGGEGETEVQAHRDQRGDADDAEAVDERYTRPLPRERPGHVSERDEQRPEPAGRPAPPPDEPDEDRSDDQVGPVRARAAWMGEMLARHAEQERGDGHGRECDHGDLVGVRNDPGARRTQARPFDVGRSGSPEGFRTRDHGLSLATAQGFRKRLPCNWCRSGERLRPTSSRR